MSRRMSHLATCHPTRPGKSTRVRFYSRWCESKIPAPMQPVLLQVAPNGGELASAIRLLRAVQARQGSSTGVSQPLKTEVTGNLNPS